MCYNLRLLWAKYIDQKSEYTGEEVALDTYSTKNSITCNARVIDIKQILKDGDGHISSSMTIVDHPFIKVHGDQKIDVAITFGEFKNPMLFTTTNSTTTPMLTTPSRRFLPKYELRVSADTTLTASLVDEHYGLLYQIIYDINKLNKPHANRANTLSSVKELIEKVGYYNILTYGVLLRADAYRDHLKSLVSE